MSNQLFTEVSVEQQEIVAGGAVASLETINSFVQSISGSAFSAATKDGAISGAEFSEFTATFSSLFTFLAQ